MYISFYLPNTMDGDDTAELNCTLTGPELKALIEDLDQACAGSRSGNNRAEPQFLTANGKISIQDQQNEGGRRYEKADSHFPVPAPCVRYPRLREKNGIRATYAGNINTYCEMKDGTWSCNDRSYEYRLERRGRLPTAECDFVFVYLSNLPDISFEQAAKASGLSSDTADYFAAEDAVLVELRTE